MKFFGIVVSGTKQKIELTDGGSLKISQACLSDKSSGNSRLQVSSSSSGSSSFVLCNLDKATPQCRLETVFGPNDFPLTIWSDGVDVHVTGYRMTLEHQTLDKIPTDIERVDQDMTDSQVNEQTSLKSKKKNLKKRKLQQLDSTSADSSTNDSILNEPKSSTTLQRKLKIWKIKPQNNEGILIPEPKRVPREDGLFITDFILGSGIEPKLGSKIKMNYEGLLPDGTMFDSNLKRTKPFIIRKGVGQVIRGLDLGLDGMRIGGSREIIIPSKLGYGDDGLGDAIPGGATLIFRVTLLG
eukprot:gene7190-14657_t